MSKLLISKCKNGFFKPIYQLDIDGVDVLFPYKAWPYQRKLMKMTIKQMKNDNNQ